MMIVQGLLVALVFYVCDLLSLAWCANPMLDRPIVLGPLVGLVLGDLRQGILLGASIELIFLGVASIGPSMPANAGLGGTIATAFVILTGADMEVALALAVPIGLLGVFTFELQKLITASFLPMFDRFAATGNSKAYDRAILWVSALVYCFQASLVFLCIAFGTHSIDVILASIPAPIIDGIKVAGGMLPAVGLGILTIMLLGRKGAFLYYLLGFVLVVFFNVSTTAVALIAFILAGIELYRELDFQALLKRTKPVAVAEEKEEEFFL